jgi:steroid 5-alpha reductase family enzyme
MMAMFLFATIPMKDQRMLQRHPGFAAYYQRVPALLPLPKSERSA